MAELDLPELEPSLPPAPDFLMDVLIGAGLPHLPLDTDTTPSLDVNSMTNGDSKYEYDEEEKAEDLRDTPNDFKKTTTDAEMEHKDDDIGAVANVPISQPTTPKPKGESATIHLPLPSLPTPKISSRKVVIRHNSPTARTCDADGDGDANIIRRGQIRRVPAQIHNQRSKRRLSESDLQQDDDATEEVTHRRPAKSTRLSSEPASPSSEQRQSEDIPEEKLEGPTPNSFASTSSSNQSLFSPVKSVQYPAVATDNWEWLPPRPIKYEGSEEVTASETSMFSPIKKDQKKKATATSSKCKTDEVTATATSPGFRPGFYRQLGDNYVCYHNGVPKMMRKFDLVIKKLRRRDVERLGAKWIAKADVRPPDKVLLEVCVDNVQSALEAVKGGAKRLELSSALVVGGLTPSPGFVTVVKELCPDVPLFVMIRPRAGDFVYTSDEIKVMIRNITLLKKSGADGFVFGVLTNDSDIHIMNNKSLQDAAHPLPCTFHRAFDRAFDSELALEKLIGLGFSRLLTSGLQATAHAGIYKIKELMDQARRRITIVPTAGITDKNVADIVKKTGAVEVHASASKLVRSLMSQPGPSKPSKRPRGGKPAAAVKMGAVDDSVIQITDAELVDKIIRKANRR